MSEPSDSPRPYRVAYSGRVRDALEALIIRATERGLSWQVLDALNKFDYRLRIYPQFGEPLQNLAAEPAQVWIGTVPPLVVHYILDESRRSVTIVRPFSTLPGSGLDP